MKKLINSILLVVSLLSIIGCSNKDVEYYTISGRILNDTSNEGMGNAMLNIKTYKIVSSYNAIGGSASSGSAIEEKNITTDQNGNFSVLMLKNSEIRGVTIRVLDDGNYVGKIKDFVVNDFENILITVTKYEVLKIIVKNLNPFDSNDKIRFSAPSDYLILRENFGVQNEVINQQPVNIWVGTNINSELTYKVSPNFTKQLEIYKTKNGVETFINTGQINIVPNQTNIYNIIY